MRPWAEARLRAVGAGGAKPLEAVPSLVKETVKKTVSVEKCEKKIN